MKKISRLIDRINRIDYRCDPFVVEMLNKKNEESKKKGHNHVLNLRLHEKYMLKHMLIALSIIRDAEHRASDPDSHSTTPNFDSIIKTLNACALRFEELKL
jgi:hypothetical protein